MNFGKKLEEETIDPADSFFRQLVCQFQKCGGRVDPPAIEDATT